MFQPVGGMDMIAEAFQGEVDDLIRFHAKVIAIYQSDRSVKVH
jgi:monoamine oxidase